MFLINKRKDITPMKNSQQQINRSFFQIFSDLFKTNSFSSQFFFVFSYIAYYTQKNFNFLQKSLCPSFTQLLIKLLQMNFLRVVFIKMKIHFCRQNIRYEKTVNK